MGSDPATRLPSVARFAGYAEDYDCYRPSPPDVLATILTAYAGDHMPGLVVDLGCGTGLSTRYWAERARDVVGVDPSVDMLRQAVAATRSSNVSYSQALGHQTGLADGCADIVVCANALHWMEPAATYAEIARLLRPAGVFAAYYNNQYPSTLRWEADQVLAEFRDRVTALDAERGITEHARRSRREDHLADMQASGHFRFIREFAVHQPDVGNAQRLIGLAMSNGFVRGLLNAGVSEAELGLDTLRREVSRILGDTAGPWLWTVNLWVGVV